MTRFTRSSIRNEASITSSGTIHQLYNDASKFNQLIKSNNINNINTLTHSAIVADGAQHNITDRNNNAPLSPLLLPSISAQSTATYTLSETFPKLNSTHKLQYSYEVWLHEQKHVISDSDINNINNIKKHSSSSSSYSTQKLKGVSKRVELYNIINNKYELQYSFKAVDGKNISNSRNIQPYQRSNYVTVDVDNNIKLVYVSIQQPTNNTSQSHQRTSSIYHSIHNKSVAIRRNMIGINTSSQLSDRHPLLMLNTGRQQNTCKPAIGVTAVFVYSTYNIHDIQFNELHIDSDRLLCEIRNIHSHNKNNIQYDHMNITRTTKTALNALHPIIKPYTTNYNYITTNTSTTVKSTDTPAPDIVVSNLFNTSIIQSPCQYPSTPTITPPSFDVNNDHEVSDLDLTPPQPQLQPSFSLRSIKRTRSNSDSTVVLDINTDTQSSYKKQNLSINNDMVYDLTIHDTVDNQFNIVDDMFIDNINVNNTVSNSISMDNDYLLYNNYNNSATSISNIDRDLDDWMNQYDSNFIKLQSSQNHIPNKPVYGSSYDTYYYSESIECDSDDNDINNNDSLSIASPCSDMDAMFTDKYNIDDDKHNDNHSISYPTNNYTSNTNQYSSYTDLLNESPYNNNTQFISTY